MGRRSWWWFREPAGPRERGRSTSPDRRGQKPPPPGSRHGSGRPDGLVGPRAGASGGFAATGGGLLGGGGRPRAFLLLPQARGTDLQGGSPGSLRILVNPCGVNGPVTARDLGEKRRAIPRKRRAIPRKRRAIPRNAVNPGETSPRKGFRRSFGPPSVYSWVCKRCKRSQKPSGNLRDIHGGLRTSQDGRSPARPETAGASGSIGLASR